jgi:hypothetical protein
MKKKQMQIAHLQVRKEEWMQTSLMEYSLYERMGQGIAS